MTSSTYCSTFSFHCHMPGYSAAVEGEGQDNRWLKRQLEKGF
jgi:hypothetical protein